MIRSDRDGPEGAPEASWTLLPRGLRKPVRPFHDLMPTVGAGRLDAAEVPVVAAVGALCTALTVLFSPENGLRP
jgi:hypothetical protein